LYHKVATKHQNVFSSPGSITMMTHHNALFDPEVLRKAAKGQACIYKAVSHLWLMAGSCGVLL